MRKAIFVSLAVVLLVVSWGVVFAQCDGYTKRAQMHRGKVANSVCPVLGGGIDKDTPYIAEYKGRVIGFCCAECVDKFNANPEGYSGKLEEKD